MDPVEGWVEVRDEPRHRRRFEDEHIRMYDVLVAPGDTTLFHRHTEDTLYISINDARVQDRTWGSEEARTGDAPAGLCLCRPHRARPLIHQVTNVGDGPMRMIGAEIKASPPLRRGSPLDERDAQLVRQPLLDRDAFHPRIGRQELLDQR